MMTTSTLSWAEVCAIPWLQDLPVKIETNRYNKILMSPASAWHGSYELRIGALLQRLLPSGEAMVEAPVTTSDGIRVADVACHRPHRRAIVLPIAPDICVEVLSPSNTRAEMLEKMQLYYAAGAREVWLCDECGRLEFFTQAQLAPVPRSEMCPDFPLCIDEETADSTVE